MDFNGKKVLIIGGTGTIGGYLTKEILKSNTEVIRIFSRDEYKQYNMSLEYSDHASRMRYLIGDVRDYQRLCRAMEDIDYVFHLAAMKHVPFCEYNPFEAVQTNVIGTQNVIQAAIQCGVKKVLFTSTDKAVNPTNTYGATKLTGEKLVSAAEYQKGPKATIFCSVRFGNVMGSRGSVIPLFKEQIRHDGIVTVTDVEMTRYMMTPLQATSLILKAMAISEGGEVFVLKMPMIKIIDLVEVMIEEVSKKYSIKQSIEIKEIGLRPGEKMYEELMMENEAINAIETDDMFIIPSIFHTGDNELSKRNDQQTVTPIDKETLRDWLITEELIWN